MNQQQQEQQQQRCHDGSSSGGGGASNNSSCAQNNHHVPCSGVCGGSGGVLLLHGSTTRMADEELGGSSVPHCSSNDYGAFVQQQQQGGGGGACEELDEKNLDEPSIVLENENGAFQQRMWGCFQNCARAVAQVYMTSRSLQLSSSPGGGGGDSVQPRDSSTQQGESRTRSPPPPHPQQQISKPPQQVEESFKSAAQHATSLYKDSIETSRRLIDLAIKTGSNRRTKEVLAFVKSKKKRFIKREELISFLVGERSGAGGGGTGSSGAGGGTGGGGGGGGRKDVSSASSCRGSSKNHGIFGGISSGGVFNSGGFDVAYPHLLHHHVHSAGGGGPFSQGVSLSQQQSHHLQQQQQHQLQGPSPPLSHCAVPFSQHLQQQQSCSPPQQQSPAHVRLVDGPVVAQFSSSLFAQRKPDFHGNDNASIPPQPQRLVISNNLNNSSNNNNGSSTVEDNDLHLAVQQLFVAGAAGGIGNNEFVHVATGVKRPAPEDPDDGTKREDEDEEDCMMEDSVDGGSDCFKRMRFY